MHCPVCNSLVLDITNSLTHLDANETIFHCSSCGHTFVDPSSTFNIESYNATFYKRSYNVRSFLSIILDYIQSISRFHYIKLYASFSSTIRLLEVGPGFNPLSRINPSCFDVAYIETDNSALNYLSSRSSISYSSIDLAPNSAFDLIVFNHVLEHIVDINSFLSKCFDKLVPGGLLLLEVPNLDFYRTQSKSCLPHYHSFSLESIHRLFENHGDKSIILSLDQLSYESTFSLVAYRLINLIFRLFPSPSKDLLLIKLLNRFGLVCPPFRILYSIQPLWIRAILKKIP